MKKILSLVACTVLFSGCFGSEEAEIPSATPKAIPLATSTPAIDPSIIDQTAEPTPLAEVTPNEEPSETPEVEEDDETETSTENDTPITNESFSENDNKHLSAIKAFYKKSFEDESITRISISNNHIDVEGKNNETDAKVRRVFDLDNEAVSIETESYAQYKEGEVKSWDIESGKNPNISGEVRVFLISDEEVNTVSIPEGFSLYDNSHFDFQIGYPKNMYYRSIAGNSTAGYQSRSQFATEPVTTENAIIVLDVMNGELAKEEFDKETRKYSIPRDEDTYFALYPLSDEVSTETLEKMKASLSSNLD